VKTVFVAIWIIVGLICLQLRRILAQLEARRVVGYIAFADVSRSLTQGRAYLKVRVVPVSVAMRFEEERGLLEHLAQAFPFLADPAKFALVEFGRECKQVWRERHLDDECVTCLRAGFYRSKRTAARHLEKFLEAFSENDFRAV